MIDGTTVACTLRGSIGTAQIGNFSEIKIYFHPVLANFQHVWFGVWQNIRLLKINPFNMKVVTPFKVAALDWGKCLTDKSITEMIEDANFIPLNPHLFVFQPPHKSTLTCTLPTWIEVSHTSNLFLYRSHTSSNSMCEKSESTWHWLPVKKEFYNIYQSSTQRSARNRICQYKKEKVWRAHVHPSDVLQVTDSYNGLSASDE